jgi:hypothetical protein
MNDDNHRRLVVRPRYQGPYERGGDLGGEVWQVVGDRGVVATVASRKDAAKHVLKLHGRIWLEWSRTVISGREGPLDFTAKHFALLVGRIYCENGTSHTAPTWRWTMFVHVTGSPPGSAHGRCEDRTTAIAEVERAFTKWLASED